MVKSSMHREDDGGQRSIGHSRKLSNQNGGLPWWFPKKGRGDNLKSGWLKVIGGLHAEKLVETMASTTSRG